MRFFIFINDDADGDDCDDDGDCGGDDGYGEPLVVEHNNDDEQEEVSHNEPQDEGHYDKQLDEGHYDKPRCLCNQAHSTQFRV